MAAPTSLPFLRLAAPLIILISTFCVNLAHSLTNVTVDNEDIRILYSPTGWVLQPNPQIGPAINGTVTLSKTAGSWLSLDFEGTAIYLVGDDHSKCWSFDATIDGVVVAESVQGTDGGHQFVPYWGYEGLSAGVNHTFNLTIMPNTTLETNFIIDALLYTIDGANDNTTTTTAAGTSTGSTTSLTSQQPISQTSISPHSDVAPIVGGVVGGVVGGCIILLAGVLVAVCFRRKRSRASLDAGGINWTNTVPRPILTPYANEDSSTADDQATTLSQNVISSSTSPIRVNSDKPSSQPSEPSFSERVLQEMSEIRAELAHLWTTNNSSRAARPSGSNSEHLPSYDDVQRSM